MNNRFLIIVLFLFSFVMLINSLAYAERECTRQVTGSGGTKSITIDCSSSSTETSENFTNRNLFSTLASNLMDRIHSGIQDFRAKLAAIFSSREHSEQ